METITFYSYKGGSGRSLLLANAAQFLALTGKRVVALDLDFEAPGLHYKMHIGEPGQRTADVVPERGVVDYLLAASDGAQPERLPDYVASVALPRGSGELALMPAGAAPSGEYWRRLTALAHRGVLGDPDSDVIASFLELKARLEDELEADYLLIDARTGITELAGIATTLLADKVVCLMIDNPESLAGTRAVLRSFGRAVRLDKQDPVEVLAVLSRVSQRDEETERRVIAFLDEPGPSPEETLALDRLFVLPSAPEVAREERILLDGGREGTSSALAKSYLVLMSELAPADAGSRSAAFRRQQAVRAMRGWLTEDDRGHRHRPVAPRAFPEDHIDEGVPFGSARSRYADLAAFDREDRAAPLLVAEYVEDLAGSEAWRWWQDHTWLRCVLLFGLDEHGRLERRAFTRARGGPELHERDSDWGLRWPTSHRALRDPGDQSVAARLEALIAGGDDFIALLVQDWQRASFITLHGVAPFYRPRVAREIVDGLASVTDIETELRVLWRTASDPFERADGGMMHKGAQLEELATRRLHAPLFWRLSAEAKTRYWRRSRDRINRAGIELLADDLLGLRFDQDEDLRRSLVRLLDEVAAEGKEPDRIAYAFRPSFRERELSFEFSTDAPPELVRRALLGALLRSADMDPKDRVGWDRAEMIATDALDSPAALTSLLREGDGKLALVTTNLLGLYDPATCRVTLYRRLLDWCSTALDISLRQLENVVFIHETVHAICHLGRDLDGRSWPEFALPSSRDPAFRPSALHAGLGQYFTFRLIERLEDEALMDAFERLTEHQPPEYQAWRSMRDVPVEQMRARLMRARDGTP